MMYSAVGDTWREFLTKCMLAGEEHPYAENLGRMSSEHGSRLDYLDSQL